MTMISQIICVLSLLLLRPHQSGAKVPPPPTRSVKPIDISNHVVKSILVRGGVYDQDETDYDEDEEDDIDLAEEDEATAMHQQRRNQRREAPPKPPTRPQVDARGHHKAPYIPRKKKKKNVLSQLASSSLSISKKAAVTTVQTSGKAAYYLMRPKSISRKEIWGIWRLDQQVGIKQSIANIELTPRGMVIIKDDAKVIWKAPYRFIEPMWPQSCRVEFEARAFQPSRKGGKPQKPWLLYYKGYLERKVADSSVIKMVGKLYEIERPKSMFGKDLPVRYNKIGSFVGRKRIMIQDEESEDEEYDEEQEEFDDLDDEPRYRRDQRSRRNESDDEEDEYDDDA